MKTIKKRRKQFKTDYEKRYKLLKSKMPRIIFRKTNKYIISQYIISTEAKDKIIIGLDSRKLVDYGWPENLKGSLKSIAASYLTGYLIGKKLLKEKLAKPILDAGMIRVLHKTKVFAFIKGLIDAGVKVQCKIEAFPEEGRIKGENLKEKLPFEKIKEKIEKEND